MNSFERVMNTLQGQPADRVPVFAVLGAYGGKLTGTDLRTLYTNANAWVAGQQALQATIGLDLVLATFDYSALGEAFGSEVAWSSHQTPNLKNPAVREAAAALALALPDPHHTARLPMILEATRHLAGIYRERVPIFGVLPGPCALPALILGLDTWLDTLLFDEPAAQKLLERTGKFFAAWANALLEAGATGLVITEGMAAAEMVPRRMFAERFLPHIRHVFAQVRGPMVFHHTGGRINSILDLIPGLPNVIGVTIGSKDDLAEARQLIGPDQLLTGNLDNLSFPTDSAAEIRARSLACLQTAAPAGHFILCNSGADIPLATPPENLRALLQASEDYAAGKRSVA